MPVDGAEPPGATPAAGPAGLPEFPGLLRARRAEAWFWVALTVLVLGGALYARSWQLGLLGFVFTFGTGRQSLLVLLSRDPVSVALRGSREDLREALDRAHRAAAGDLVWYVILVVGLPVLAQYARKGAGDLLIAAAFAVGLGPGLWQIAVMLPLLRRARKRCREGVPEGPEGASAGPRNP